ncbi:GAF domain-containing protein [Lysobacter humi (ex Lee et al. 2017)]
MTEAQRQRELDTYRILDSLPEPAYDDIVLLASRLCETPLAFVSLVDRDRQWFKSSVGLEAEQTARDVAFCDHAIRTPGQLLEVPDATADARFADNPAVTGEPGVRFYAGMPLVTPHGTAVGTVCVVDRVPRRLDAAQQDTLAALARLTMNLLESRRQLLDAQRAAALAPVAATASRPASPAAGYSIAILEFQAYASVVRRFGMRVVENAMQQCEHAIERMLAPGELLSRVSGAPEFVLTLEHGVSSQRLKDLERVAEAAAASLDTEVVLAAATSQGAHESPLTVFERADEALTRRKTERAAHRFGFDPTERARN